MLTTVEKLGLVVLFFTCTILRHVKGPLDDHQAASFGLSLVIGIILFVFGGREEKR
jgi:hypothetical protein